MDLASLAVSILMIHPSSRDVISTPSPWSSNEPASSTSPSFRWPDRDAKLRSVAMDRRWIVSSILRRRAIRSMNEMMPTVDNSARTMAMLAAKSGAASP